MVEWRYSSLNLGTCQTEVTTGSQHLTTTGQEVVWGTTFHLDAVLHRLLPSAARPTPDPCPSQGRNPNDNVQQLT